jgi:hypothetical protein
MTSDLLYSLQTNGFQVLFKGSFLLILLLFLFFLFVVFKQVRSMHTVIAVPDAFPMLRFFAFALIVATLVLFLISLAIL